MYNNNIIIYKSDVSEKKKVVKPTVFLINQQISNIDMNKL